MPYDGPERRQSPRVPTKFVVSYRVMEDVNSTDVSQTKNLSLGGMLLTTNRHFPVGTILAIRIRLPFVFEPMDMIGKVIESKEIVKDLIYDTRLAFMEINGKAKDALGSAIGFYLDKGEKKT